MNLCALNNRPAALSEGMGGRSPSGFSGRAEFLFPINMVSCPGPEAAKQLLTHHTTSTLGLLRLLCTALLASHQT